MKHSLALTDTLPVFGRVRQEPRARVLKNIFLLILLFVLFFFADQFLISGALMLLQLPAAIRAEQNGEIYYSAFGVRELIQMLYLTSICILLSFLCTRVIERRSVRTAGITGRHALRDYLLGVVVGTGMMGAAILLSWAGGGLELRGVSRGIPWGTMLLFLGGWMVQGFSEELNFRGFFMMTIGTHHKPVTAVAVSALLFAAAHLGNDGIALFPVVNLTLFGLFAALYFLRTDSIWGIAAIHSMWNAAQGNLFGLKVSGIDVQATVLRFVQTDGHDWLNGGAFGPEGGAAVTVVLAVGVIVLYLVPQREKAVSPAATDL